MPVNGGNRVLSDKKIILFGAGVFGYRAMEYFKEKVYCFADNKAAGQIYMGKPVISFVELLSIYNDYDIILSVGKSYVSELEIQCKQAGIPYFLLDDVMMYDRDNMHDANPEIRKFKDIHKNKRCFLIGNGPSLTADDLTVLHNNNEVTFACNAISKIFSKTPWRPNYYAVQDRLFLQHQAMMLSETDAEHKFFPMLDTYTKHFNPFEIKKLLLNGKGNVVFFHQARVSEQDELPFSSDASKVIYLCGTIMYAMFQLAVFMGCREIYLLGVDGGTTSPINQDEYLSKKQHFYKEDKKWIEQLHFGSGHTSEHIKKSIIRAYNAAKKHADGNEILIKNTTLGNKIKIFDYICFNSLF